jgi:GAF domain-containing protein/HAMP domain-containing protein
MNAASNMPATSIRTKLLALLLGMTTIAIFAVAAIAITSAQSVGKSAQELGGRLLHSQAEDTLVRTTQSTAKENDLVLERVLRDAKKIADFAANIFDHPEDFRSQSYWSVNDHMKYGPEKQYINGEGDTSSVFVPFTATVDSTVVRDIEISAYLDLIFEPTLQSNSNIEAIYFATPRDVVRYYPNVNLGTVLPPDFEATGRIWYAGSLDRGASHKEPWWTPAYLDATGLGIVTTAAAPVYGKQGDLIGVVGMDVTLTEMRSSIESKELLPGGYSFLIDDSGRAIALPERGFRDILGRPSEPKEFGTDLSSTSTAFAPVLASMKAGESGFKSIEIEGKEYFVAYAPLESSGWSLGSVIEAKSVLKSLSSLQGDVETATRYLIINRILPVSGVVFVLVIILGLILTKHLIYPIQKLANAAEKIKSGHWDVEIPQYRNDEIGVLAQAFEGMTSQLHMLVVNLEQRVTERTQELEHQAIQLRAAAEVGHAAASLRDLSELLNQVTQLISERFGFYHVGIFLLDEDGEHAILRAANSQGGQLMLERGHQLKVGKQGIVGYVTELGRARIALDVGDDAIHFQNPLLPETRSEMALPLIAGDKLLGAIDIQSKVEAAFSQEDIKVLQVLADQVAIALQNAYLFQELQNSLRETSNLYRLHTQRAWLRTTREETLHTSYQYDRLQVTPIDHHIPSDILDQIRAGKTVTTTSQEDSSKSKSTLFVPILAQGQAIGVLGFEEIDPEHAWSVEEVSLVETIAAQLALTLENIRLLDETQKRAEHQALVAEITRRMRETLDIDSVLQTSVREIGESLGLQEVTVNLRINQEGIRAENDW